MTDDEIDFSDLPEVPEEWFKRARFVPGNPELSTLFAIALPEPVRRWFSDAPEGCEAAVQAALTEYMQRHPRAR